MNVGTLLYLWTKLVAIATNCMGVANDNYRAENSSSYFTKRRAQEGFYTYEATLYMPTVIKSSYAKWRYTRM